MYLFFDTETTGLPKKWRAPVDDLNNWPRLVQLAWALFDRDGNEIIEQCRIIRPEKFKIPDPVSRLHGITTEKAIREGIDLVLALKEFENDLKYADLVIAHNIAFDEKIIGAEILRKEIDSEFFKKEKFCTMTGAKAYCGIKNEYGFKPPRLQELYIFLFNEEFENAHDALADTKACARCFFELKNRGVI